MLFTRKNVSGGELFSRVKCTYLANLQNVLKIAVLCQNTRWVKMKVLILLNTIQVFCTKILPNFGHVFFRLLTINKNNKNQIDRKFQMVNCFHGLNYLLKQTKQDELKVMCKHFMDKNDGLSSKMESNVKKCFFLLHKSHFF